MQLSDPIWTPDNATLRRAAERLDAGGLIAVPTETVYGLAADARNGAAVADIFAVKGRPAFNPIIVHVGSIAQAAEIGMLTDTARRLAAAFWPGPLTLVVTKRPRSEIASLVTAGLDTVALRMPAHPVASKLLAAFGRPFVAPSANRSGKISPTHASHVVEEFGSTIPVLDGGPCENGIESTIIDATSDNASILRTGPILQRDLETAIEHPIRTHQGENVLAPGMMASHYAPAAEVRLNAAAPRDGEAYLAYGGQSGATLDLSPGGDLREAAANLFDYLRRLDARFAKIAVAPIPHDGLGAAINDRLTRAAAPRNESPPATGNR